MKRPLIVAAVIAVLVAVWRFIDYGASRSIIGWANDRRRR